MIVHSNNSKFCQLGSLLCNKHRIRDCLWLQHFIFILLNEIDSNYLKPSCFLRGKYSPILSFCLHRKLFVCRYDFLSFFNGHNKLNSDPIKGDINRFAFGTFILTRKGKTDAASFCFQRQSYILG